MTPWIDPPQDWSNTAGWKTLSCDPGRQPSRCASPRSTASVSLLEVGFFIPCHAAERWYRDRLNETGIVYAMVLGRPMIPHWDQYPANELEKRKKEDKAILESFRAEYEERFAKEAPEAQRRMEDGHTKIAHVIYGTG